MMPPGCVLRNPRNVRAFFDHRHSGDIEIAHYFVVVKRFRPWRLPDTNTDATAEVARLIW